MNATMPDAAGQVAAQVGAQREQGGRGRDVSHRLREQGAGLVRAGAPGPLVGK